MSKVKVNKEMYHVNWQGSWRKRRIMAESDVSVWFESKSEPGREIREQKKSTYGEWVNTAEEARKLIERYVERKRKSLEAVEKELADFELSLRTDEDDVKMVQTGPDTWEPKS